MTDEVHANTKVRGSSPVTLACGAVRAGALVSGDPDQITCSKCQDS